MTKFCCRKMVQTNSATGSVFVEAKATGTTSRTTSCAANKQTSWDFGSPLDDIGFRGKKLIQVNTSSNNLTHTRQRKIHRNFRHVAPATPPHIAPAGMDKPNLTKTHEISRGFETAQVAGDFFNKNKTSPKFQYLQ